MIDPSGSADRTATADGRLPEARQRARSARRSASTRATSRDERSRAAPALARRRHRSSATWCWPIRSLIGKTRADLTCSPHGNVDCAPQRPDRPRASPEGTRKLYDQQLGWIDKLRPRPALLRKQFNTGLFTYGASSKPETAGIGVALIGSLFMMLTCCCWRCRSASPPRSISRSSRRRTAAPTSSRSTSTTWRPCPRSCSACSALRCSSTSSACRARPRSSAAWCWR